MTKLPVGFYLSPLPAQAPYFNNSHAIERAIMYRNAIYARADMDPEVAYAIIKAVDENRAEWENISPIAPDWGTIYEYAPPYHEGVVRYYREKGIWQGAAEEHRPFRRRAAPGGTPRREKQGPGKRPNPYAHSRPVKKGKGSFRKREDGRSQ